MYLCDYHVHSRFSLDSATPIVAAAERAIDMGIRELGFADHLDFYPEDEGFGYLDYDAYGQAIEEARCRFAGKLVIRQGLEVDYQQAYEEDMRSYFKDRSLDFLIGSVHYLDGCLITPASLPDMPLWLIYRKYLEELQACIQSGLFDIIGHPDYVSRQLAARYDASDFQALNAQVAEVVELAAKAGVVLEINVRPGRLILPSLSLLRRYRQAGGQAITIGSDAHVAEEVGRCIEQGLGLARQAGIFYQATYRHRARTLLPI